METQMKRRLLALPVVFASVLFFQKFTMVNSLGAVNWTVQTKLPVFGKELELRCTVTEINCCNESSRLWMRGPPYSYVMNDGNPTAGYLSKFREEMNVFAGYFSLIIIKLEESDLNMEYTCEYSLYKFTRALVQTSAFEYHPNSSESSYTTSMTNTKLQLSAVVTKIAPMPTISANFGGKSMNITSSIQVQVYDKWFYNINLSLNNDLSCYNYDKLQVTVTAGQYSYNMVDEDVCACFSCIRETVLYALGGILAASDLSSVLIFLHQNLKTESEIHIVTAFIITVISIGIPGYMGFYLCACRGSISRLASLFAFWITLIGIIISLCIATNIKKCQGYKLKYAKEILFAIASVMTVGVFPLVYLLCSKSSRYKLKYSKEILFVIASVMTGGVLPLVYAIYSEISRRKSDDGSAYTQSRRENTMRNTNL